jgi:hypothetical protein
MPGHYGPLREIARLLATFEIFSRRRSHRGRGLGAKVFKLAKKTARERGAKSLYISATPSENTVNFYLRLGCKVAEQPERDLFELEPEDIHLGCEIEPA